MKRAIGLYCWGILMVLGSTQSFGQAVGDYRTAIGFFGAENWSSLAAWERWNGGAWVQPTGLQGYPGQFASPGTVTLDDNFCTLTLDVSPTFSITNLAINGFISAMGVSGNPNLTITNLSVSFLNFLTFGGTGNLTVNGTTTLDGSFTDDNNGGTTRFVGNVTVAGIGTFTATAVTTAANLNFRGGIANSGAGFTAGAATFDTNSQSISGTTDTQFDNNVVINLITLTVTNSGDLTISGTTTLSGTGSFTDSNNGGITTFVGNLNIAANGTFLSTAVSTTGNMIFQGGIANTLGIFSAGGGTFNTNNQSLTGAGNISFANNVAISGVTVTNSNTANFSVTGTTTLSNGGFTDNNNLGINTFIGAYSQSGASAFTTTTVTTSANLVFRGGITNSGGTFAGGGVTFNTSNQAVAGASAINFANTVIVTGVTVTNNNTAGVTMSNAAAATLQGSGTWTQGVNSSLIYSGSTITVTGFNAANTGNTVDYNSATVGQTVRGSSYYHLTLSGAGNQTKTLSANTVLGANLSILNSARLDVSTFSLSVAGNWLNTSVNADPFVQGTQTVTFNGAGTQTLTATGGETFYSLTINTGAANTVQLQNNITVTQTLTLTQGGLDLNQRTLNVTRNSTAAIARTNGYVRSETTSLATYSPLVWTIGTATGSFVFPFGTANGAANYIPLTFNVTSAGTGAAGTISIATYPTAANNTPYPTGVTHVWDASGSDNSANTVDRFWIITPSNYTTNPTSTMTFAATAAEVGTIVTLRAQRHNGPHWELPLPGQSNTATTATVPGVNVYSPWAMSGNNSPLPVELISFSASQSGDHVKLNWSTASELNNDFFTIERSADGESFSAIVEVKGKGTTSQRSDYEVEDYFPQSGKNYYRLQQTDFDGTYSYSKIVSVDFDGPGGWVAYPNPVSIGNELIVELNHAEAGQSVNIRLMDARGTVKLQHFAEADRNGLVRTSISTDLLSKGLYIVIIDGNPYLQRKVVID
ncbi:MAG: hypothetical protein AB7K37_00765 [Cyclobacteriaceae bacterium]